MAKTDYDSIIVGSGPNGLAAAIKMQQAGLQVLLVEGKDNIGGGMHSAELTLPHFIHDVCSAIHPLVLGSPYLKTLPLAEHGLSFIMPEINAAHPFDDGTAAALYLSVEKTAQSLGIDKGAYQKLLVPLVNEWPHISPDIFGPFHFPKQPIRMAKFGLKAITSATHIAKRFESFHAKGFFGAMSAHAMLPLSNISSSATAFVLLITGHIGGWPVPKGGSISIAKALASYFISLGGKIETNFFVKSMSQLPSSKTIIFDVTPKQLLDIAGDRFSAFYKWQLNRFRYGMGVFKIDWALDGPVPFTTEACRHAGTVHLGNTFEEIAASEKMTFNGKHPEKPFVLFTQPSIFDSSRAPEGKHTAWAYCHVTNGSTADMTAQIENQVERFAPGFKDLILGKHTMNANQMETYNPNYVGGDINGGVLDITQLFTRPALRFSPYKTSAKGIYICSSSTPPGGGVHGMCGYHAALQALKLF